MFAAHVTAVTVPEKVFVLKPVLLFREKTAIMFPYFAGLLQADWWSSVMQQCPKKIYTKKIILMSLK